MQSTIFFIKGKLCLEFYIYISIYIYKRNSPPFTQDIYLLNYSRNFIQIHIPILTGNDCEGAGEVFTVQPASNSSLVTEQKDDAHLDGTYFGKEFLSFDHMLLRSSSI